MARSSTILGGLAIAGWLVGCTALLGIDGDYQLKAEGGGGEGAGASSAGGGCPEPPVPPGGPCPPRCDGGCEGGVCRILCDEPGSCQATVVECPDSFDCLAVCSGNGACSNADLVCPPSLRCSLQCTGVNSCKGAALQCADGPCELSCNHPNACDDATLGCGIGACTCSGAPSDATVCGPSCACTPC